MAEVAGHLSVAELGERFRVAADTRSARHVQAIWLLAKGHAVAEVAATTAFGVRWVEKLLARYNAGGPDALGDLRRRNGTRATILKPELLDRLRLRLAGPPADGGLWTSREVAAWMAEELGLASVAGQRGWEALRAVGWSGQGPRPEHPARATAEEQEAFKKGSIRVGCCGRPCGGQEPGSRGTWLGRPLERSSPTEIVRQVARRDAVEAAHPALQPAVVGVHVLDVEGAVAHPDPGGDIDRLVADAALGGEGGVGPGAVPAEDGGGGDHGPERRGDGVGAEVGQHGVGGVAGAVAGDQRRDLLGREPALARPLAAPARSPRGRDAATAPSAGALVGPAKEGLVRLDHAAQRLARRPPRAQEPVPPAEAGRQVHAAVGGGLGQAHAPRERLAVAQPARLLAQPRQGGAGQRVEGLAAGRAAVAAQPAGGPPALRLLGAAMRAARRRGERSLEQPHRLGLARGRRQGPP